MKKILFCLALTGLAASCRSTADVSASSDAAAPKAECCAGDAAKECTPDAECNEAKTCPVTGKTIN